MSKMLVVADGEIRLGKFEPEALEPPRVSTAIHVLHLRREIYVENRQRPALAGLSVIWSRIFMALLTCFDVLLVRATAGSRTLVFAGGGALLRASVFVALFACLDVLFV